MTASQGTSFEPLSTRRFRNEAQWPQESTLGEECDHVSLRQEAGSPEPHRGLSTQTGLPLTYTDISDISEILRNTGFQSTAHFKHAVDNPK